MTSLDAQVAALKDHIAKAAAARARADHESAVAEDALSAAMASLKSEFRVTTLDEARALLERLDAEAEAECRRAAELLDSAEEAL